MAKGRRTGEKIEAAGVRRAANKRRYRDSREFLNHGPEIGGVGCEDSGRGTPRSSGSLL